MKHMWSEEEIQELIEEQGGSSGSGGSEVHLYRHVINIDSPKGSFVIENDNNTPFTFSTLCDFLVANQNTNFRQLYPFVGIISSPKDYAIGLYASKYVLYSITSADGITTEIYSIRGDIVTQIF